MVCEKVTHLLLFSAKKNEHYWQRPGLKQRKNVYPVSTLIIDASVKKRSEIYTGSEMSQLVASSERKIGENKLLSSSAKKRCAPPLLPPSAQHPHPI
ncbi:hypothetical protein PORY_000596 [Pneumocystis oryctolagi]|uniref:Uncharacterized protein n=1 Tax=Pneumocystis oryctolagi TaxID=42067 RepID=A0ACB7CD37_9ASCO|nr:hypothetical protein PORY_000596 [Pneumocystis oryctolagi]